MSVKRQIQHSSTEDIPSNQRLVRIIARFELRRSNLAQQFALPLGKVALAVRLCAQNEDKLHVIHVDGNQASRSSHLHLARRLQPELLRDASGDASLTGACVNEGRTDMQDALTWGLIRSNKPNLPKQAELPIKWA